MVGIASDRAEGSQQRRKRKREQQDEGAAPLLGGVQWANPYAYKRAFRWGSITRCHAHRNHKHQLLNSVQHCCNQAMLRLITWFKSRILESEVKVTLAICFAPDRPEPT